MNKYWIIRHDADTNETGLSMRRTYVETIWKGFPVHQNFEKEIIEDFCFERFGKKTVYVQGVAPVPNWEIHESDKNNFDIARPINWGGYITKTTKLVIEIGNHGTTKIITETNNKD